LEKFILTAYSQTTLTWEFFMKWVFNVCLAALFVLKIDANEPEPYRSIIQLPEDPHHWFLENNRQQLEILIKKDKPKIIVELGSWLGASAIFMASLLEEGGVVYAVDDWTANTDTFILADHTVKHKLSTLYQQFLSNVKIHKQTQKIVPMRMKTVEAAKMLDVHPDLIYLDASHDEESVYHDVMAWYPKLNKKGTMCGDDWLTPSVQAGVLRAAKELGLEVKSVNFFWYFLPKQ
jgi:hypothetical protein